MTELQKQHHFLMMEQRVRNGQCVRCGGRVTGQVGAHALCNSCWHKLHQTTYPTVQKVTLAGHAKHQASGVLKLKG